MGKLTESEKKKFKTIFRLMQEKTEAGLMQAFDVYDELHAETGADDPGDAISKAVLAYLNEKKQDQKTGGLGGRKL